MNMVWDRHVSNGIRELGYDVETHTLAVVFPGKKTVLHAPVPYELYASLFHSYNPERVYRETIKDKIPVVTAR
ncbi:MAG: hypothetical protein A4E35_00642 [Methanoregula sp. PtaU1.Bin051]|nr:MAG: hypothetical protein A4E35_00642 [Methanoregula sp. PtaU1.Bin051]